MLNLVRHVIEDKRNDDDDIQSIHSVIIPKGKNGEFPGGQQPSEALRLAIGLVHQTETKEKWVTNLSFSIDIFELHYKLKNNRLIFLKRVIRRMIRSV